ncbi:MAG TPA: KUP/HAK/KT family potassium transporter [Solirubrobacteraceae bacterium]|nr:KUP/HAK/KT family potassium transporter [Solirubrobacteraceae bacterium]
MAGDDRGGGGRSSRPPESGAPGVKMKDEQTRAGGTRTAQAPSPRPAVKRNFNEAAHKLGHWPVRPAPVKEVGPSETIRAAADEERDVVAHAGRAVLALGALGIVYGDIGTSPLYTMQVIFSQHADAAHPTPAGIYGVVSLIFWTLMIVVSTKYAVVIMRAHNRGDGGGMALAAVIQRRKIPRAGVLITLGLLGAGLFFGDGMITPAISVTSAVGGLNVISPSLSHLVVPISLAILVGLFAVQRYGTGAVGWMFGPVILVFFTTIGAFGLIKVIAHPEVLQGLSPTWAIRFLFSHGVYAWLALGAVVLCCTGAEALYADRGHFGATPIRQTWFGIVLPCVMLSYLGQAAFIREDPAAVRYALAHPDNNSFNPFFQLFPHSLLVPIVILATLATIIASQAALTGSFSVAKQAVQLGFLPRLKIRHTSELEGQIYVPVINWFLGVGVIALVLIFQSSTRLSDIYGVAVTGTFILDTTLFVAVARSLWKTARWRLAALAGLFYIVEVSFFTSNLTKVSHGAWLPLGVGALVAVVMVTWRRGRDIVTHNRNEQEGSLEEFLDEVRTAQPPMVRLPVTAVFLNPGKATTPLALRAQVEHNHAFHDKVVIVSLDPVGIPRVDRKDRFVSELLGKGLFKVVHLTIHVGYHDSWNVPAALVEARKRGFLDRNLDLEHASYFVSRMTITPSDAPGLARWRKQLFIGMARNATSPIDAFGLPGARTVMTGSQVAI